MSSPIIALHEALGAAIHRDLPDIDYQDRDWAAWQKLSKEEQMQHLKAKTEPTVSKKRRPSERELEVYMFNQTWGSTALGYGGMGGSAMTDAYTVVVEYMGMFCVYFGCSRLAYIVNLRNLTRESVEKFSEDLDKRNMPSIQEMSKRYIKK